MLQADVLQADTRATPCSQPLCAPQQRDSWHRQRPDIPELSNGFNGKDMHDNSAFWKRAARYILPNVGYVVQRYSTGLWPVCFRCPAFDL